MKKHILFVGLWLMLLTLWLSAQETSFVARYRIQETTLEHETDIRNFLLTASDGTAFYIMGDNDLPIIKALAGRKRVRVTLEEDNPKIER